MTARRGRILTVRACDSCGRMYGRALMRLDAPTQMVISQPSPAGYAGTGALLNSAHTTESDMTEGEIVVEIYKAMMDAGTKRGRKLAKKGNDIDYFLFVRASVQVAWAAIAGLPSDAREESIQALELSSRQGITKLNKGIEKLIGSVDDLDLLNKLH